MFCRAIRLTPGKTVSQQASCGKLATAGAPHPPLKGQHYKHQALKVATWNVRGLSKRGTLEVVEKVMDRYGIEVLGISETHIKDSGHYSSSSGKMVIVSGTPSNSFTGVGFLITKHTAKMVLGYEAINDRILKVKLSAHPYPTNIIVVYAPTSSSSEDAIEEFYNNLNKVLQNIPSKEPTIVMGDFNAKIGETRDDDHLGDIVGKFGLGERNLFSFRVGQRVVQRPDEPWCQSFSTAYYK